MFSDADMLPQALYAMLDEIDDGFLGDTRLISACTYHSRKHATLTFRVNMHVML